MTRLDELPTELRQKILEYALPQIDHRGRPLPKAVQSLALINKRLYYDMGPVFSRWSPLHYPRILYREPFRLHLVPRKITIGGVRYLQRADRVCLKVMEKHDFMWDKTIDQYLQFINSLRPSLQEVYLDISFQAPTAPSRNAPVHPIQPAVYGTSCHCKNFQGLLRRRLRRISTLMKSIDSDSRYEQNIAFYAIGGLSETSDDVLTQMAGENNRPIRFIGEWISAPQVPIVRINTAVSLVIGRKGVENGDKKGVPNALSQLRTIDWSFHTTWDFAIRCHSGRRDDVVSDLRALAEFLYEQEKGAMTFNSVGNDRKALRIKMATDMGLRTAMKRFWDREYLIVSKAGAEL